MSICREKHLDFSEVIAIGCDRKPSFVQLEGRQAWTLELGNHAYEPFFLLPQLYLLQKV
jgi:hypothetical protein